MLVFGWFLILAASFRTAEDRFRLMAFFSFGTDGLPCGRLVFIMSVVKELDYLQVIASYCVL